MSTPGGQYTLYYSRSSPFNQEEVVREERFNDLADAVAAALLVSRQGGSPTHVIYDDAVLFSGDDLKQVLSYISGRAGGMTGAALTESVRTALPGLLTEQLTKTVKFAHEHFGAVAVYRDLLEELYKAADQAIQNQDLGLLHAITGKLAFWYVPTENDVKQWGKDFLYAYRRDAGWLRDTKKALEEIETAAKELEVEEGSRNAQLKAKILKAAEDGLITHI